MATAFLRKFKPILNARRIKPNPLLTYEGLWKLARPNDPVPNENSDWPLTWTHAKVWLEKFRIPGLVIDIKGKVRCRYDPPRVNTHLNHTRFDIILHNKHVWLVNKNVAEFGKRYSGKQPEPELPRPRNSTEISDKWPRPDEKQQKLYFVDSVDEILNIEIGGTTEVAAVTGEEPEDFIRELVLEHNIEPGSLTCRNGVVEGFSICHPADPKIMIRVKRALSGDMVGDQPDDRKSWSDEDRHKNVLEWIKKLSAEMTPKFGLSHYNEQVLGLFDRFRRGPRCGIIKKVSTTCLGIDVVRAYTHFTRSIEKIPVFSKFDRLEKIPEDAPISDETFYLVHSDRPDLILFPQNQDLVPGSVLRYAEECGIKYTILGQLVPHQVLRVDPASVIDEMYESDLQDEDRKYVANLVYGLAARRNNKAAFGQLFQDTEEAKAYSNGQMRVDLAPGLHLVVDQVIRELSEGYRLVAALILNGMRILLHKIVSALGDYAVGVRMDCVYTTLTEEEARLRLTSFTFGKKIGDLRFVQDSLPPEGKLQTAKISWFNIENFNRQTQIRMNDEFDNDEAKRIIEQQTETILDDDTGCEFEVSCEGTPESLLVTGKYPGSGKSRLALHWGNKRKDMLVVCPTNVLCDSIWQKGYTAITTHKLLGRRPRGSEEEKFTPFDVWKYNVILFEEIYFYPVFQLEWIRDFLISHPSKIFIANGDPAQNEPVGQTLSVNFDAYYDQIMRQMFLRRLDLQIPKRYAPRDRERMTKLYDELLREQHDPFVIAKKYLPVVQWKTLTTGSDAARCPHVAFTNESVERVNRWAQSKLSNTLEWKVGDVAIGKTWAKVGKHKINSNSEYLVTEIMQSQMTVKGQDGILRTMKKDRVSKLFKRPWCRTGHSIQGQTVGDKLYIHDPDSFLATARWLRTAVTRCKTLDIILVTFQNPCHMASKTIQQRISNHVIVDRRKGRPFNSKDYVTEHWARQKIKTQGYSCAVCLEPLDLDWSIDRIDNSRAHVKDNCQISCRRCQNASGHR